ncbi:hypothetical protein [Peptoniphilus indolicus]|nr:hypothetical protein [Peptoniphilus indolicus]
MLRKQNYSKTYQEDFKRKIIEFEEKSDLTKEIKFEFAKVGYFKKSIVDLLKYGVDYEKFKNLKIPTRILRFGFIFLY